MIKNKIKYFVRVINKCRKSLKKLYNKNLVDSFLYKRWFFIVQVLIIIYIVFLKMLLVWSYLRLYLIIIISLACRFSIRYILYFFGWTGKTGEVGKDEYVEYLPELKKLYNKNFVIKKAMNFLYFYGNIWYIVPYFKKSNNIIVNISINFIFYVLKEIYLPIKKKIITGYFLYLLNIKLFIVIIILWFEYSVILIIGVWLIVKMIKAIWLEMELSLGIITKLDKNCKQRKLLISIKKEYNIFSKNIKNKPKKLIIKTLRTKYTVKDQSSNFVKVITLKYIYTKNKEIKNKYLVVLSYMSWFEDLLEIYCIYNKKELKKYKKEFKEFEEKELKGLIKEWVDIINYINKKKELKLININFGNVYGYVFDLRGSIELSTYDENQINEIINKDEKLCERINEWSKKYEKYLKKHEEFEHVNEEAYGALNDCNFLAYEYMDFTKEMPIEVRLWIIFPQIYEKYFSELNIKNYEVVIRRTDKSNKYHKLIEEGLKKTKKIYE